MSENKSTDMNLLAAFIAILTLTLAAWGIAQNGLLTRGLTVFVPYAVWAAFLAGFVWRIVKWGRAPVPFPITTTCGQQCSLPGIKSSPLESPAGPWGVIGRMALEVLLFRSLFRNATAEIAGGRPVYGSAKWLWFFALLFHW